MKKVKLFNLFLIYSCCALGQNGFDSNCGLRANLFAGHHFAANRIASTNQSMDGNVTGLDIGLMSWGLKNENFSRIYGKPRVGLDARIIKMNNTDTFGYCAGLLPTLEIEILHRPVWTLQSKVSFGLNYNNKQYDFATNFDNRAIVSPINFAFDVGILFHATLTNHLELNLGSGLYHISNGSLKMPNGGINIAYLNAGVSYYPQISLKENYRKPDYSLSEKRVYYMGYGAFAYRQLGYFNNLKSFWVFSCVNQAMFKVNHLYAVGAGIDAFYDATHPLTRNPNKAFSQEDTLKLSNISEAQKYYLAIGIASRFDIGKLFIPVGIYTYLYNNKYVKDPVYLRFGLGYQFHKHLFTGLFFKGTLTGDYKLQSDFMEWSFGVRL